MSTRLIRALQTEHVGEFVELVARMSGPAPLGQEAKDVVPGPHGDGAYAGGGEITHRSWQQANFSPQSLGPDIAIVSGEELVTAVAGERHRHVLARQLGDEEGRDLRRIGKGLIPPLRQSRNDVPGVLRLHVEFGVIRSQVPRNGLGMPGFVVAAFVKADGECAHRAL